MAKTCADATRCGYHGKCHSSSAISSATARASAHKRGQTRSNKTKPGQTKAFNRFRSKNMARTAKQKSQAAASQSVGRTPPAAHVVTPKKKDTMGGQDPTKVVMKQTVVNDLGEKLEKWIAANATQASVQPPCPSSTLPSSFCAALCWKPIFKHIHPPFPPPCPTPTNTHDARTDAHQTIHHTRKFANSDPNFGSNGLLRRTAPHTHPSRPPPAAHPQRTSTARSRLSNNLSREDTDTQPCRNSSRWFACNEPSHRNPRCAPLTSRLQRCASLTLLREGSGLKS